MASREVTAMVGYLRDSGVRYVITATVGTYHSPSEPCAPHAANSYHCKPGTDGVGRAIDAAEMFGGGSDTPGLLAIRNAFAPVEHLCAQVIYAGPGHPPNILHGQPFDYDAPTMAAHHSHVHLATELGVYLAWPTPAPPPPWGPIVDMGDGMHARFITIHTDDHGNGHSGIGVDVGLDHPATVAFATLQGPYPPVDGYAWPTPNAARAQVSASIRDGKPFVTLRGGDALRNYGVFVAGG